MDLSLARGQAHDTVRSLLMARMMPGKRLALPFLAWMSAAGGNRHEPCRLLHSEHVERLTRNTCTLINERMVAKHSVTADLPVNQLPKHL